MKCIRKKRTRKTFALAALLLLSLSACAATDRQVGESENTESSETGVDVLEEWKDKKPKDMPERLSLSINEGIEIDGFIEVSSELSDWNTEPLTLTRHLLDEKKCVDDLLDLLGNPKVVHREHITKEDTLEDGSPLQVENADLENDAWVQSRNLYLGVVFPEKDVGCYASDCFLASLNTDFDKIEKNKTLEFGSWEEICPQIEAFLEKQNIENIQKPVSYAFTQELLQQSADNSYKRAGGVKAEQEMFDITVKKEDEEYLIRYTQGYKGIPYDYVDLVENDVTGVSYSSGTDLTVFYGTKGIREISGGHFFDIREVGEEQELLSLYDVLNLFRNSHKRSAENKITVTQIGLSYLPIVSDGKKLEFDGVPVWYLLYHDVGSPANGSARNSIVYNAVTGEIYQ